MKILDTFIRGVRATTSIGQRCTEKCDRREIRVIIEGKPRVCSLKKREKKIKKGKGNRINRLIKLALLTARTQVQRRAKRSFHSRRTILANLTRFTRLWIDCDLMRHELTMLFQRIRHIKKKKSYLLANDWHIAKHGWDSSPSTLGLCLHPKPTTYSIPAASVVLPFRT